MKKALEILDQMIKEEIIEDYAIGGAVGVIFYTEPTDTKDLDIFVLPKFTSHGMVDLSSIYGYLRKLGYKMEKQWFVIEGIPVDFIPVYDELTQEAFETAIEKTYENLKTKVLQPEYLLAIALKTGRPKDLRHVDLLLEQADLNQELLQRILIKYNLRLKNDQI